MKKINVFIILSLIIFCWGEATAATIQLPNQFTVTDMRWFTLSQSNFKIDSPAGLIGRGIIHEESFFGQGFEYRLWDPHNSMLGMISSSRSYSEGIFEVLDDQLGLVGVIREESKQTSLLGWDKSFAIESPEGLVLAKGRSNYWKTKYIIVDAFNGKTIAKFSWSLNNSWLVQIEDSTYITESKIHPLVLLTLACFQEHMEIFSEEIL